jgi:hypothetical protein
MGEDVILTLFLVTALFVVAAVCTAAGFALSLRWSDRSRVWTDDDIKRQLEIEAQ